MKTRLIKKMLLVALTIAFVTGFSFIHTKQVRAETRIKDIVAFEGIRDNMLVGYGLVVGLNGTGDSLSNSPFTRESIISMLDRLGVNIRHDTLNTKNIAAVTVTATLPPFINQGSRIDITVSTLGDAESLQGGTLLVTPLLGADGNVYAVAQGPVAVAGFTASGDAGSVTQNIPTTGRIPSGAIVEREIDFKLADMMETRLNLRNPDLTTAKRIVKRINSHLEEDIAHAENPASIKMKMPTDYEGTMVNLLTDIEQLTVEPDQLAKVVIDERSGTIVMGQNVRISTIALAQGNLTIRISEQPQVSQPKSFAQQGETAIVARSEISIDDDAERKVTMLRQSVSLQDLVSSLNALGVGPRDIITILQSISAAGALQAEIEVM